MTDITKCNNQDCPIKDKCYRYLAKANSRWQSWHNFTYDDGCEHFWDIEPQKEEGE